MFSQGVSNRTSPFALTRIFHIIVRDDSASTGWRTWCGAGLAREDPPGPYLHSTDSKLCSKCRHLAADALADGTLDESEAAPFAAEPEPEPDRPLTAAEAKAVAALKHLASTWPKTLMLASMDGTVCVLPNDESRFGRQGTTRLSPDAVLADFPEIPSTGGDW